MSERIQALPWDSNFFGVSIGKVDLNGTTEVDLEAIRSEGHDRGFDCVYGAVDPSDGKGHTALRVQAYGHELVEVNILLRRAAAPLDIRPTESVARIAVAADMDLLQDTLDRLAPWSRFGVDPRFGQPAARRMHEAWVERAIQDDTRMLAIAEDSDGISGLSTHTMNGPTGEPCVDLLGVVKPGTGASAALMKAFHDWAPDSDLTAGPAAARNHLVINFCIRHGYMLDSTHYTYHWWPKERT